MPHKEINARIARLRKLRAYRQKTVAQFLGLKTSTYSQMERNGNITGEMILKIAEVFEVDPMIILCGETKEELPQPIIVPETTINLTDSEECIINVMRNLNKSELDSVYDFISKTAGLGIYKGTKRKRNKSQ